MPKTPATRDWSQLRTDILNAIGLAGSTNAQARALAAQKRAVDMLNTHRWRSLLTTQDVSFVADQAEYAADASFRAARRVMLLNTSSLVAGHIGYVQPEIFDERYPNRATSGTPTAYTVRNTAPEFILEFDKPASSDFLAVYPSFRIRLYPAITPLVGATDNFGNDQGVTSEMEFFVELYSRYLVCRDARPGEASEWKREAMEVFQRLSIADNEFDSMDWE